MLADVLLLSSVPSEPHVAAVQAALARRDAATCIFDPRDFPSRASLQCVPDAASIRLRGRSFELELTALKGVWWFRAEAPRTELEHAGDRAWADEQARATLESVWAQLPCRIVPGLRHVAQSAELKPQQLALAARLGLSVPATLVTNDPNALLRFYEQHGGQIVAKVLCKPRIARSKQDVRLAYTHVVERRDLLNFRSIADAPMIFQAYVPKQYELRLTVVGDEVFAARLDTQASERARHDSRHIDANIRVEPHALPEPIANQCVALVKRLGLSFATLDLIVTPSGEHVFLEVNPSGRWWWVEERAGLCIADALASLLTSPPAAQEAP